MMDRITNNLKKIKPLIRKPSSILFFPLFTLLWAIVVLGIFLGFEFDAGFDIYSFQLWVVFGPLLIFYFVVWRILARNIFIKVILNLIVIFLAFGILIFPSVTTNGKMPPDLKRIGDMRQLQLALEGYYDDYQIYPGGDGNPSTCAAVADKLSVLVPNYIAALPRDPATKREKESFLRKFLQFFRKEPPLYYYDYYFYDASAKTGGQEYVLRALLNDVSHTALTVDIDGIASENFGCDCEDKNGYFCARP